MHFGRHVIEDSDNLFFACGYSRAEFDSML
jgi:hypothetical protein